MGKSIEESTSGNGSYVHWGTTPKWVPRCSSISVKWIDWLRLFRNGSRAKSYSKVVSDKISEYLEYFKWKPTVIFQWSIDTRFVQKYTWKWPHDGITWRICFLPCIRVLPLVRSVHPFLIFPSVISYCDKNVRVLDSNEDCFTVWYGECEGMRRSSILSIVVHSGIFCVHWIVIRIDIFSDESDEEFKFQNTFFSSLQLTPNWLYWVHACSTTIEFTIWQIRT